MNRNTKYSGAIAYRIRLILFSLAFSIMALMAQSQSSMTPFAYWSFETTNPPGWDNSTLGGQDALVGLFPATNSPVGAGVRFDNSIIGNTIPILPNIPFGNPFRDSMQVSVEALIQPGGKEFDRGMFFLWPQRVYLFLSDFGIEAGVYLGNGLIHKTFARFDGLGIKDYEYYRDGNWHHIAFTWDSPTGVGKIYVDGQNPHEFRSFHGPSAWINLGFNNLSLTDNPPYNRWKGGLDEVAVYDTVLTPELVWQHWLDMQAGNPYNFSTTLSYNDIPPYTPVHEAHITLRDFTIGHPTGAYTPNELLDWFPWPRYSPRQQDSMPYIRPWFINMARYAMPDSIPYGLEGGRAMKNLVEDYHYALQLGMEQQAHDPTNLVDTAQYPYHAIALANDPQWDSIPRCIPGFWRFDSTYHFYPVSPQDGRPFILHTDMEAITGDPAYYVRDSLTGSTYFGGAWSPTSCQTFTRAQFLFNDGITRRNMLKRFTDLLNWKHLELVGENDEVFVRMDEQTARRDTFVNNDYLNFNSWTNWQEYLAIRRTGMKQLFRNGFRDWVDSLNTAAGRDSLDLLWYTVGEREPWFDGPYEITRDLLTHPRGERRSTPYYYPEYATYWRYARNQFTGWNEITRTRRDEYALGERFFQPYVSPGFDDGSYYPASDTAILRPGQYLGMMKAMGVLGADTYIAFMYDPSLGTQNWVTWKPVIKSYAQAAIGRERLFLEQGEPVIGDTVFFMGGETGKPLYELYTGNRNDLVVARKMPGQERYLITGTTQKNGNDPSHGLKEKDVCFALDNTATPPDSVQLRIRLQGSTYVLDRTILGDQVIYQTDKWHEWYEPSHWCQDYCHEAEVYDNAHNGAQLETERPPFVAASDFREFTTYLSYPSGVGQTWDPVNNPGPILEYRNKERMNVDRFLSLRFRTVGASGFYYRFNGGSWSFVAANSTNWIWTNPYFLASLLPQTPILVEIMPQNSGILMDRLVLRPTADNLNTISASFQIGGPSTACTGVPVYLTAQDLNGSQECKDLFWDFGDGEVGYDAENYHTYHYPGTYQITLRVRLGCEVFDTTLTHTITISGPMAEAGPDIFRCGPDSVQISLDTTNAPTFHWRANNRQWPTTPSAPFVHYLSDSTILHPMAYPDDTLRWYWLYAVDGNGCKAKDSLRAQNIIVNLTAGVDSNSACSDTLRLWVDGAWYANWSPGYLFDDSTSLSPTVSGPNLNLPAKFTVTGWDACHCDTSTTEVYVTCCEVPSADTVVWRMLASDFGGPGTIIVGQEFHVLDSFIVDSSIEFQNCVFWMDEQALITVRQGAILTADNTVFRSACGTELWTGIVLETLGAELKTNGSRIQEAEIAVNSLGGGKFDIRGSTLDMNHIHLRLASYSAANGSSIRASLLTCSQPLLFPYQGQITKTAVLCENAGKFTFGFSTGTGQRNVVEEAIVGFRAEKSDLEVYNTTIRDIRPILTPGGGVAPLSGVGILFSLPAPLGTAQFGTLMVGHPINDAFTTTFQNCQEGIYASGNCDVTIRNANMSEIKARGIMVTKNIEGTVIIQKDSILDAKMGIQLGALTNCPLNVDQNVIESYVGTDNTGILCDMLQSILPSYNYQIQNNRLLVAGRGIYARVSSRMYIFQNRINMATMPFAPPVGFETYALRFEDCNNNQVWTNLIESDPSNIGPDSTNPGRYWMHGAWFYSSANTDFRCNTITNHGNAITWEGVCTPSQMFNNVMNANVKGLVVTNSGVIGQQGNAGLSSGNRWVGPIRQSETLFDNAFGFQSRFFLRTSPSSLRPADNDVAGSGTVFRDSVTTSLPPICLGIVPSSNKTGEYDQIAQGGFNPNSAIPENQWKAEQSLYWELNDDPNLITSSSHFPAAYNRLDTTQKAEISWMVRKYLMGAYASACAIQSGLSPSCTTEDYWKQVWSIFLGNTALALDSLTPSERSTLLPIAHDCPTTGGAGVIWARAILATDGHYIWSEANCTPPVKKTEEMGTLPEGVTMPTLEVFPNPAADLLTIRWNGPEGGLCRIFDASGQLVWQGDIESDQPEVLLSVANWPAGIYAWHFTPKTGESLQGRITVMGIR